MAVKRAKKIDAAEQARSLTEEALELYDQGRTEEADALVEQALALDRATVEEVVREMDEDAESREE
jgi:cellobiose-specific phosphotransferase system component IIA